MKRKMTVSETLREQGMEVETNAYGDGWKITRPDGRRFVITLADCMGFDRYYTAYEKTGDKYKVLGTRCLITTAIRKVERA